MVSECVCGYGLTVRVCVDVCVWMWIWCNGECVWIWCNRACVCVSYSLALCFTCAWYSSIVTGGLLHLLLLQLINVSYNVTEREARLALREKTGRSLLGGLIIDTGVYSQGFRNNWAEFLTMADDSEPSSPTFTELV